MRSKSGKPAAKTPKARGAAAPAKSSAAAAEVVERGLRARIAKLEQEALRFQTAFDAIAQGVCLFDADERLILANRRFADIYRLTPDQIAPGATLREIVELRVAAGTSAMAGDDHLSFRASNASGGEARVWATELKDGRTIQVHLQPMPGGGWVSTHMDISQLKAAQTAADELLSLQALIDQLPDNLWVKDVKSRFVIANQITASRMRLAGSADLIGKTDLELLPLEIARKFYGDEQNIVRSGQPMVDMEEYVFDGSGGKTWILTTKVPLRNDTGEIFGVAGISRDITERRLADALREGQTQVLEMIAMSARLEDVLEHLVHLVESQFKEIIGAVLLLDETGTRLKLGAAPSLPKAYIKLVEGARIGPDECPSGAAAYRREPVFVADLATDPLGAKYKDLAAGQGIRSCWSTPILSHRGAILGVFAMYSKQLREPNEAELRLIDVATRIAGIAIERKLAEDRIQLMSKRTGGRSEASKD